MSAARPDACVAMACLRERMFALLCTPIRIAAARGPERVGKSSDGLAVFLRFLRMVAADCATGVCPRGIKCYPQASSSSHEPELASLAVNVNRSRKKSSLSAAFLNALATRLILTAQ